MVETKEKTIDGLKVSVTQWPARKAWKYKRRLAGAFGPAIAELGAGLEGNPLKNKKSEKESTIDNIMDGDFDFSKLGSAIEKLFLQITEDSVDAYLLMFFDDNMKIDNAVINGDIFDQMFAGKMLTVYKIIGFVLEVNYGSFLGKSGIGSILKKL